MDKTKKDKSIISYQKCGPIPNVMAALQNIGGALCSTPQSLATPTTRVPCSNAAKTRNRLKFAGVPQTNKMISAACGPKFTILWGHMQEILSLNNFFPIVDMYLSCEDIARQSCGMVPRWRLLGDFFASCISASYAQHVRKKKKKKPQHENIYIWPSLLHRTAINQCIELIRLSELSSHRLKQSQLDTK